MNAIDVRLERAGSLESTHAVHAVVTGPGGDRIWGDERVEAFWRSSMKPFQSLPLVDRDVLASRGLGDAELAIACASHHGTPLHVEVARRILDATSASEDNLACGAHRPLDKAAAIDLDREGTRPGRLHNNCSGKHAGMIALAGELGVGHEGYHEPEHAVQSVIRETLADWITPEPETLEWGVDGCGVPTPRLALTEMAAAYARFGASEHAGPRAVAAAMTAHPTLVSGGSALSASLMATTGGRLMAKEGAEGVFCVTEPGAGWGAAFKVADGAMRAYPPAVVGVLARLGVIDEDERARLATFAVVDVRNTRDESVARLVAEVP